LEDTVSGATPPLYNDAAGSLLL